MTAIRLKSPWKIWPVGHVIPAMQPSVARLLIARGVAEEVGQEKPARAALAAPVDRAVRASQMTLKRR